MRRRRALGAALAGCLLGCAAGSTGAPGTSGAGATAGTGGSTTTASAGGSTTGTGGEGGGGGVGGGSGGSNSGGATSTGGSGGASLGPIGCADGTREGFGNVSKHQAIAACNGAWDIPGIFKMPVMCNRQAGNTGVNAAGVGCTVSDLCADKWHVCHGKDDVLFRNKEGCEGVMTGATSPVFFTTQMSSTGAFQCSTAADATNDLFGCGDLGCDFTGNATAQMLCAPLVLSSHDLCKGLRNDLNCGDWCNHLGKFALLPNAWSCGNDTTKEAFNVTKTHADQQGGVLCCLD